jgi:hypothetical protein
MMEGMLKRGQGLIARNPGCMIIRWASGLFTPARCVSSLFARSPWACGTRRPG